jgi:DNA invertase Pin-like site-specific DNA recombinase
MESAMLHKFDAVLVWKLDRFGRSMQNLLTGINGLRAAGVRFLAVSQNIDTDASNPTSGLLLNIMAAMAEFERELLIERTKSGLAHARANGKVIGRPRAVFRRDEVVRLHGEGWSYRKIARRLGIGTTLVMKTIKAAAVGGSGDSATPPAPDAALDALPACSQNPPPAPRPNPLKMGRTRD